MCKRPKENANVISGPWKVKSKREVVVPDIDVIALQENIMFADDLTESLLVQMIHTMGENGVDVSSTDFIKDISFVIEAVKGVIYRDMGLSHPMSDMMSQFTDVTVDEGNNPHGLVDLESIQKVKITKDDDSSEPEPEPA
jgi:hypothetical protein|tara:strand:+ start:1764 stop:2183 length:420 start_codon:yes stop_codon:yes gene_type:complete